MQRAPGEGKPMKNVMAAVMILFFALILGFAAFVWPTRYRYHSLKMNENVVTIREDRFSDKTWMLLPTGWVPNGQSTKPEKLTAENTAKVTGRCDLRYDEIRCDISNTSDYRIQSVTVAFHPNGSSSGNPIDDVLSACTADLEGSVEPHTMGHMSVTPPCVHDLQPGKWSWNILAASGYRK